MGELVDSFGAALDPELVAVEALETWDGDYDAAVASLRTSADLMGEGSRWGETLAAAAAVLVAESLA